MLDLVKGYVVDAWGGKLYCENPSVQQLQSYAYGLVCDFTLRGLTHGIFYVNFLFSQGHHIY